MNWRLIAAFCITIGGLAQESRHAPIIPETKLLNQDGQPVVFSDLVRNKIAVVNSIFTTCTTICPVMGANFGRLQKMLGDRVGKDVVLISISVDPVTDTPERLKAWRAKFQAGPGWTLLTGPKPDVDLLLKSLGLLEGDKTSHSPAALIYDSSADQWKRADGLASPEKLAAMIPPPKSAAANYFTDVPLVNQDGQSVRLYTDLIKGRVVVINTFFTSCRDSCPVMAATLARLQDWLGSRLGKQVYMVSFTVDPKVDTPQKLKEFARHMNAKPGWQFITGQKDNLSFALKRIGEQAQSPDLHNSLFIIGNDSTGLWKKVMGMAPVNEVIRIVETVANDPG